MGINDQSCDDLNDMFGDFKQQLEKENFLTEKDGNDTLDLYNIKDFGEISLEKFNLN